jgi:hypothetical protein
MWFCPERYLEWGLRGFVRKDTGKVVFSGKILRMEFYVILFGRIAGMGFLFGFA